MSPDGATAEIVVGGRSYRMVLPHAGTDYIQKKLLAERQPYELEMLEDMGRRVRPDDLVVDIGANVGNHTMYLAAIAGCKVVAFEPNGQLCEAIAASAAENALADRVQIHNKALGAQPGRARFATERPENLGAQRLALHDGDIEIVRLDDVALPGPARVLKIDVEGMEDQVLAGAIGLLKRDRPLVYAECQKEPDFRKVCRCLEAIDYGYWDTFNATPTHLFMPNEAVSADQRVNRMLSMLVSQQYKLGQHWLALKKLQPARLAADSSRVPSARA